MSATPSTCRNCGDTERYEKEVSAAGGHGPDLLPIGFFVRRKFRIEVCAGCGLVEWFVPKQFIKKVRERFDRIP